MMALAGGQVTAIDAHSWIPGSLETMTANMAAYGVADRVAILCETSCSAMPRLAAGEASFGLIFVDVTTRPSLSATTSAGRSDSWHPAGCSRAMITVRTAAAPACGRHSTSCYPRAASSLIPCSWCGGDCREARGRSARAAWLRLWLWLWLWLFGDVRRDADAWRPQ